jgi:ComF family protein
MVHRLSLGRWLADRCPGCDVTTASGFCADCVSDFVGIDDPCPFCGLDAAASGCPRDSARWSLDRVVAPFEYVEPLRVHVQRLKFAGQRRLGRALGELFAAEIAAMPAARDVDAIAAVPLHRSRLLERGYNQAFELARPIAAELRLPLLRAGIGRRRATAAQSCLTAEARYANVRDAFDVSRDVRGIHIGIVDDVLTTGATLNALADALKRAGASRVDGWTIARAR